MPEIHILNWTLPDGTEVQTPAWLDEKECEWFWTAIELQIQSGTITDRNSFGMQIKAVWETASRNAIEADIENGFGEFNRPIVYDKKDNLEQALRGRTKSIWYSPGEFVKMWSSPVDRLRDTYQGVAQLLQFRCAVGYAFGYPIELWRVKFVDGEREGQRHNCQVWASGRSIVVQDPSVSVHDRVTKERLHHPPGTLVFDPISSPPTNHPELPPGNTPISPQPSDDPNIRLTVGSLINRLRNYDPGMPVELIVRGVLGDPVVREVIITTTTVLFPQEDDVFYLLGGIPKEVLSGNVGKEIGRMFDIADNNPGGKIYDG